MATPKKIQKFDTTTDDMFTSVSGYVHQVSPLKVSLKGNRYFNAILQEQLEFTSVVGYNAAFHKHMKELEDKRSPVKLANVVKVSSWKSPGKFDLKMVNKSLITTPKTQLQFTYEEPPKVETDVKTIKIQAIKELPEGTKVTVNAKIVNEVDKQMQPMKYGPDLLRTTFNIADDTGSIECSFWGTESDKIKTGSCYCISNATIKSFNKKKISTNPVSNILPITDIGWILEEEDEEIPMTQIIITGATITHKNLCFFCKASIVFNAELSSVKCTHCNKRQLISSVTTQSKCEIDVADGRNIKTYLMNENVMQTILPNKDMTSDEIELFLLQTKTFQIQTLTPTSLVITKITNENKTNLV